LREFIEELRREFLRRLDRVFSVLQLRNSSASHLRAEKCVAVSVDNSM
jgi:hypothetical protein